MFYTDNLYGSFHLPKVLEEIIKMPSLQRLKRIHQGGAIYLVQPVCNQTRFDHSIGVMLLIRLLGGSEKEQIAGIIHDISHTAFSHIVDYVLENGEEDYHEQIFERILRNGQIGAIVTSFGYSLDDFIELEKYPILESPLPDLSADRIDYTLRDLFQIQLISREEIDWFLDGLILVNGKIAVKSVEHARWFKEKYNVLLKDYFGSLENQYANSAMTQLLKSAMDDGVISLADFETDDFAMIEKIEQSQHQRLIHQLHALKDPQNIALPANPVKNKKRFIDPEILVGDLLVRLSDWESLNR